MGVLRCCPQTPHPPIHSPQPQPPSATPNSNPHPHPQPSTPTPNPNPSPQTQPQPPTSAPQPQPPAPHPHLARDHRHGKVPGGDCRHHPDRLPQHQHAPVARRRLQHAAPHAAALRGGPVYRVQADLWRAVWGGVGGLSVGVGGGGWFSTGESWEWHSGFMLVALSLRRPRQQEETGTARPLRSGAGSALSSVTNQGAAAANTLRCYQRPLNRPLTRPLTTPLSQPPSQPPSQPRSPTASQPHPHKHPHTLTAPPPAQPHPLSPQPHSHPLSHPPAHDLPPGLCQRLPALRRHDRGDVVHRITC